MPRIKLIEQPHYEFSHSLTVRITDLNQAMHVGTIEMTGFLHVGRVYLFNELKANELDMGDGRTGTLITDLAINFRSEAFLFDQLEIYSHIGEIEETNFRLFQKILKGDKIVALAETGLTTFDFSARRKTAVPEIFLSRLRDYCEGRRSTQ